MDQSSPEAKEQSPPKEKVKIKEKFSKKHSRECSRDRERDRERDRDPERDRRRDRDRDRDRDRPRERDPEYYRHSCSYRDYYPSHGRSDHSSDEEEDWKVVERRKYKSRSRSHSSDRG